MPSDLAFRVSTYLTLALSCVCLGYSEWDILPEAGVLAGIVLVMLAISFRTGSRYELDLQSANRVGLAIGLVAAGWMAYQFVNKDSLIYTLPWPASLLPYLGPLLMVLMPAKLFRPKHVGDWWAMHGIALAGVGLASSMADDEVFGGLLGLYAVCAMTSLTTFFYRRSAGTLPPIPHTDPGPPPSTPPGAAVHSGRVVGRALGWLALALLIALPVFFLTPRSQATRWQFGTQHEVGLSSEKLADLNHTGELSESDAIAFHVRATQINGRPKDDLNPTQRWRAYGLRYYSGGQWSQIQSTGTQFDRSLPLFRGGAVSTANPDFATGDFSPPDLGPDQYRLEFKSQERGGAPVVSDPVAWVPGQPSPIASLNREHMRSWRQMRDGSFSPRPLGMLPIGTTRHVQITRPIPSGIVGAGPDLSPPFELQPRTSQRFAGDDRMRDPLTDPAGPVAPYRSVDLPKLQFWTRTLLERLARTNPAVQAALGRARTLRTFQIDPGDYEAVARALSDYLAYSGEYTYTMTLRRADVKTDPVEEFLYQTKEGHCQRFASGLALMLRSVGVPTNYILGFRGCEHRGNGEYVIRQSSAHAWVDVLVVRPPPPGYEPDPATGRRPDLVCHWLSLDPTPLATPDQAAPALTGWLGTAREKGSAFFQDFIVGYNQDRRQETVASARSWLIRGGWVVVGILAAIAGLLALRPARRRRPTNHRAGTGTTGIDWYDRLTRLLAGRGYPPPAGATPREYAESVARKLTGRADHPELAAIPVAITQAFYDVRYGGEPPAAALLDRVNSDLDRLQSELQQPARSQGERP